MSNPERAWRPAPALSRAGIGLALLVSLAAAASAQPGTIEKFEIQGNEFISLEAFLALTDLEVGDPFDERVLHEEFLKLYETGLFEDLRIEAADAVGGGQVVIFVVREKPRVDSVTYEKVKAFDQSRLEDVLRQEDALITINSTLDEERVSRTKKIIEELLASDGHPDARVTVEQRRVAPSRVALDFRIDPGPKIKIDEIRFTGNTVFSERQLKKLLENTSEHGLTSFLSDKDVFYRPRFEADLAEIREAYRAKGYLDVQLKEPVIRDARPGKSGKEDRRFIALEVPIEEGEPYRLGDLTITGNTVYSTPELRALIPLAEGEILNDRLLRLGISRIDNRYGDDGYLYAVTSPRYTTDEESRLAQVDVQVTENEQFTVRRIEFDGNVRTRDEVLRREMRVQEGDVFSRRDFLLSLRKIAQLGFWEIQGEPTIRPAGTGENEVDITVRGQEVGRNEIQFGGGFSGIDGFFATFSFQSRNFMGRGSQFSASGQIGGRTTNYSLSYVEPYFMKTRASLGGQVFARDRDFDGFDQEGQGASIFWAIPTSTFSSLRVTGSWENSEIVDDDEDGSDDQEFTTFAITPSFRFDTRDNPFRPTRGRFFRSALELGSSEDQDPDPVDLGGTVEFFKPRLEFTQYWRTFRKQYAAIHVEGGLLMPFSSSGFDNIASDGIDAPFLPVFERLFLGGENSIRGVEIRSVGPRLRYFDRLSDAASPDDCAGGLEFKDADGDPGCFLLAEDRAVGGNAYVLANFEYSIPVSDVFEVTGFLDVGNSFGVENLNILTLVDDDERRLDRDVFEIEDSDAFDLKGTAGLELRFHTPVLQQPLRLIYGCKVLGDFGDDEGSCDFQFSIGRTFQ